tara:strand:- start:7185 stop:8507 length:1323 start_codon:yes stop_codon:yes gene_type:complete
MVVFTSILITILFQYLNQPYTGEGELEAQEAYLYSQMVESWGTPPNLNLVKTDIENINLNCAIFTIDQDWNSEKNKYGTPYWSSQNNFPAGIFSPWTYYLDFADEGINLPQNNNGDTTFVQLGLINQTNATAVTYGNYVYYFGSSSPPPPGEELDWVLSIIAIIILIIILYISLRNFLAPVLLMKKRVYEFENGDLDSTIPITGQDELASLAKSVNKMTKNIRILLNQKQMLLLDVSHELRTPLARMQLLVEMIPKHKNTVKLKEEIVLLEGMISNLLLSDKLSTPYTNLQLSKISMPRLIDKVKEMFPDDDNKIKIITEVPNVTLEVDELKMMLAIRNLLDNAIKYSEYNNKHQCEISFKIINNLLSISIRDFGRGIKADEISKLTEPFYRAEKEKNIKGFGIGLTIVKKVIEAHKGKLIIESDYGAGSVFTLEINIYK